jgi:hypothetical protein
VETEGQKDTAAHVGMGNEWMIHEIGVEVDDINVTIP